MKAFQVALAVFCFALLSVNAANYAVLVAGSNNYYNYRHQADVFHAYQSLISRGFNPNNIITFAYDDIANSRSNPFPGQVFNFPSPSAPGKDVYAGVKIDYKGTDVTPENFLNALKGSDELRKKGFKVLESTSKDNVFIFFSDHGATGLIAFPTKYLYANDLIATLKDMYANQKYNQLVFYLEACESGSMFQTILPQNINVYATTAANAVESSWATYCSPDDRINGKSIGSCLGDLYSVKFLENYDSVNPREETLITQFGILVQQTTLSHVQRYGDISISNQVIGNFLTADVTPIKAAVKTPEVEENTKVDSRYVKLHYLQNQHKVSGSYESYQEVLEEEASIQNYDRIFSGVAQEFDLDVNAEVKDINFDCLKQRVSLYEEMCGKFSDYGLQYIRTIHNTCSQGVSLNQFQDAVLRGCSQH